MARALYEFGPFQLDAAGRRLTRAGETVPLTPKTFDTLSVLVSRREERLSRSELIAQIWPDTTAGEHNLNQCIAVLRKVLDDNPKQPNYIATLPGHGYSFIAEVRTIGNSAQVAIPQNGHASTALPEPSGEAASDLSDREPATEIAPPVPVAAKPSRLDRRLLLAGLLAAFLITAGVALSPRGTRFLHRMVAPTPASITVLPFENLGGETDQAYIAHGLTEELSAELGQLGGLRVVVGSPRLNTPTTDIREVARRLHVDTVLKGSLRRTDAQYRLAVQLVSGSDGRELWTGLYDGEIAQLPAIEEQVVRHTADVLHVATSPDLDHQLARRQTENAQAHDLYLQARYLWSRRDYDKVARSIELLQQAIAIDPAYARAYAGLADSYAVTAINIPSPQSVPLAVAAAHKALELDPSLAEPHATLGLMKAGFDWDHQGAKEEFNRALALNPGYATAHHWAGLNLTSMGEFEAADEEFRKAQELDPLSPMISEGRFENFYYWHHFDDAIRTIQTLQAQDPDHTHGFNWALGRAYAAKGMYPEAVAAYQIQVRYEDSLPSKLGMARVQALAGDVASARAVLAEFEGGKTPPTGVALDLASVHLALGEKEAALPWLAKGVREHEPDGAELRWDPRFDSLKEDPRFLELRQQMVALSNPQRH